MWRANSLPSGYSTQLNKRRNFPMRQNKDVVHILYFSWKLSGIIDFLCKIGSFFGVLRVLWECMRHLYFVAWYRWAGGDIVGMVISLGCGHGSKRGWYRKRWWRCCMGCCVICLGLGVVDFFLWTYRFWRASNLIRNWKNVYVGQEKWTVFRLKFNNQKGSQIVESGALYFLRQIFGIQRDSIRVR